MKCLWMRGKSGWNELVGYMPTIRILVLLLELHRGQLVVYAVNGVLKRQHNAKDGGEKNGGHNEQKSEEGLDSC